jgi:toxin HigB-1
MIKTFKNKETEALYNGKCAKKWLAIRKQAEKRLHILDMATDLADLKNLPSNRFESLQGNRKEQYSIRVNLQWRICFRWFQGEPYDVEIVDYH